MADGYRVELVSAGHAHRYADATGRELPAEHQRRVDVDTVFDLASVTKLFTATAVVQLADRGLLGLDDPVGRHLDSYTFGDRGRVTVRQLLTHTSGLPAEVHYWRMPDPGGRRRAVLEESLEAAPGTRSRYSCVGYLTLGLLVERLSGLPLEEVVRRDICAPLGLTRTGYLPLRWLPDGPTGQARDQIAATELRPSGSGSGADGHEQDLRGVVHDENAASLGGVAGNAGLFASATDLLTFGRAVLDTLNGTPSGLGLSPAAAAEMLRPQLPDGLEAYQSGLGWRIDDPGMMTGLLGRGRTFGHPGFTGTSLLLDADRDLVCALLTNRVHPSRDWSVLGPFRQRLAELLASRAGRRTKA